jgi:DNA-binding CsgD family transcriptional regulator
MISSLHNTIILILFLTINSCQQTDPKKDINAMTNELFFDSLRYAQYLEQKDNTQKIDWILQTFQQKFTNINDADVWLSAQLNNILTEYTDVELNQLNQLTELLNILDTRGYKETSIEISKLIDNKYSKVFEDLNRTNIYGILASHYNFLMQRDSLSKYVNLLQKEAAKTEDPLTLLIYYSNKANLANLDGDFFEAAVYYKKALKRADFSDTRNRATLFQNLATMYLNMDYVEKAKESIDSALAINELDEMPLSFFNTIGVIQYRYNDFSASEITFNRIIEIAIEQNNLPLLAQSYANYANQKRRSKDWKKAYQYNYLSDSICGVIGLEIGLIINQINLAHIYFDESLYLEAKRQMLDVEKIMSTISEPRFKKDFYELFYQIEDALGNPNQANEYFRLFIENKQKYLGDLPRSVIAEWEFSEEREQRLQENFEFSKSIEQQRTKNYFIAFISALSLFVLTILLLLNTRRSLKAKKRNAVQQLQLKHELEVKTKELLNESMQNIQIEQIKENIYADLKELMTLIPKTRQQKFQQLKRKLKPSGTNSYLEEFEVRFKGVHESFYIKLQDMAPDLTPNELRICAFIRLNLTTKDMALLTNRTIGTIENARITIRKKLKIDKTTNLQKFIIQI